MFDSALSTNLNAVCLLRQGRFDACIHLLKAALASVQEASQDMCDEESTGLQVATVATVPLLDNDVDQFVFQHRLGSNKTCCFDVFLRGFLLEGPSLAITDENAALCAAVGLYNMALAMQLKGLLVGGTTYLRKASGLYQKAFTILRASQHPDEVASLLLATLMNLIACQGELCGHAAADEWMSVYNDIFSWVTTQSTIAYDAVEPEELEDFASSAVLFASQSFCTAPAA